MFLQRMTKQKANMKQERILWAFLWALLAVGVGGDGGKGGKGDKECKAKTLWVETTEFRNIPEEKFLRTNAYYDAPQVMTKLLLSTKSIPYFVTQTQMVPQFMTRLATLPQYITHTVFKTFIRSITKTVKTYHTITAIRTQKFYSTVCPYNQH
nr:uncharacterized protein LOC113804269 [Penaeus vannamei]